MEGEGYTWHSDEWDSPVPDAVIGPHQALSYRFATYIFYLNDEFEGGRTQFRFKDDIYSITPKQGMLLLFPATNFYFHRGETVTSGNKYIATGWLHNYSWIDTSIERSLSFNRTISRNLMKVLPMNVQECL